ncbi:MAG: hypothetical protein KC656_32805, partial [Myxococcales bacterium]|nr:hypothetical protein [Myxococcales bacterium]
WLSGCLLGVVVEVVPPTLEGGPRVLSPAAAEDGTVFVREGSELTLRLALNRPIDLDASSLTLEGAALDCAPTEGDEATLLCRRTFDGEEGSGPKGLTGELVDASGRRSAVATPALVQADFIPPTAGCVLSPRSARAADRIRLAVVPSEPLEAPPVVTATVPGVGVGDGTLKDGQYLYDVTGPAGVDVPAYTLVVPAVDRAGNPAEGGSLCAVVDRTGSYLGLGPVSDGEIQVTADPSIDLDGVPWVRAGAVVTVRIPTVEPVDPEASRVTLSGLDLLPVPGVPGTWSRTVTGLDGDGLKDLEAQLVDDARNPLGVRVEDVIGFDLTPPSGACFVSPSPANGVEPVTFSFTPEEPLREPPTFVSGQVVIAPPERSGARWRSAVQAPPEANTTFLVEVTATDRVGNEASGAQVCAEADRTGQ